MVPHNGICHFRVKGSDSRWHAPLPLCVITSTHQDTVEGLHQMQTGLGTMLLDFLASRTMTKQTSVDINRPALGIQLWQWKTD